LKERDDGKANKTTQKENKKRHYFKRQSECFMVFHTSESKKQRTEDAQIDTK
jgi:hypothetical protein